MLAAYLLTRVHQSNSLQYSPLTSTCQHYLDRPMLPTTVAYLTNDSRPISVPEHCKGLKD